MDGLCRILFTQTHILRVTYITVCKHPTEHVQPPNDTNNCPTIPWSCEKHLHHLPMEVDHGHLEDQKGNWSRPVRTSEHGFFFCTILDLFCAARVMSPSSIGLFLS